MSDAIAQLPCYLTWARRAADGARSGHLMTANSHCRFFMCSTYPPPAPSCAFSAMRRPTRRTCTPTAAGVLVGPPTACCSVRIAANCHITLWRIHDIPGKAHAG